MKTLTEPERQYRPETVYAHKGDLGWISGHSEIEGYWVLRDGRPCLFEASDTEFTVIEEETCLS